MNTGLDIRRCHKDQYLRKGWCTLKILMVSPYPMHPTDQGSRIRIKNLFLAIREAGHDVDFLNAMNCEGDIERDEKLVGKEKYYTVPFSKNESLTSRIRRFSKRFTDRQHYFYVNNGIDDLCSEKTVAYVKQLDKKNNYEVIWVEYIFLSRILEAFGRDKLKILDTHDLFTDRYKKFLEDKKTYRWFSVSEKDEIKAFLRSDVVLAIQDEEAKTFNAMLSERRPVRIVGHQVELCKLKMNNPHKMFFMASDIQLNIDAIHYFIDHVFPQIRACIPDAQLIIAGKICCRIDRDTPGIITVGYLEALREGYGMADIAINPILYGTGLKIKSVEALGFGRVLVSTSQGAVGLDDSQNEKLIIADSPEKMAEEIIGLMQDEERMEQIAQAGFQYAKTLNRRVSEEIQSILIMKA